jgi:hypothetical protein
LPPLLRFVHEGGGDERFNTIWGSGPTDIYAVGFGTILHSNGDGTWQYQTSGTGAKLTGVWGSGPQDIYVSTLSNAILHSAGDGKWDHTVFTAGRTFTDIWGSGPNDVYALSGGASRFKTGMWVEPPEKVAPDGILYAIWGSSATDVYVAGTGSVYHSKGDGAWSRQTTSATYLPDISGSGSNDIYVVTYDGILHSNGNGIWTPQSIPPLLREDGSQAEYLISIWVADATAIYAGTLGGGRLFRSSGDGLWAVQDIDPPMKALSINGIWGTSRTNIYVATDQGIYHGTYP